MTSTGGEHRKLAAGSLLRVGQTGDGKKGEEHDRDGRDGTLHAGYLGYAEDNGRRRVIMKSAVLRCTENGGGCKVLLDPALAQ